MSNPSEGEALSAERYAHIVYQIIAFHADDKGAEWVEQEVAQLIKAAEREAAARGRAEGHERGLEDAAKIVSDREKAIYEGCHGNEKVILDNDFLFLNLQATAQNIRALKRAPEVKEKEKL